NYATSYGGGIYVNNAGNLVNIGESETKTGDQKNFIIGNLAEKGGGIALVDHLHTVLIQNNIIGGTPEFYSNVASYYGGGIYSKSSGSYINQNVIANNYTGIDKDKFKSEQGFGAGIALDSATTEISKNWILDNFSFGNAGGIGITGGKLVLSENTITENKGIRALSRTTQQLMGLGDDLYLEALTDSCIITNNILDHLGSYEGYAVFLDTISSGSLDKLIIENNNVWNTTGKCFGGFANEPTGLNGNLSVNPHFVDPENDNFNLDIHSPCNGMGWNPDPGNTVAGDTTYYVPDDYTTITQAMNAAIYGDIIKVKKGYNSQTETFPVVVKSGVHLTGMAFEEDSLNLNLISETLIVGNPESNLFHLDTTDDRTIIAGFRMTGADTAIRIRNGSAFIYGNIFDSLSLGVKMKYYDTIFGGGFNDHVFLDHNTFSDGYIDIEYDSLATSRTDIGQIKMYHGPIISYNIGSVFCNLDSINPKAPFHLPFEMNDFWPNGITGCNVGIYGLSASNFQQNPEFHDEPNDDFHLNLTSPCLLYNNYTYLTGAQYQHIDVDFSGNPVTGTRPLSVSFTDNSGPALTPLFYYWTFGDGNHSADQNPTHVYADTGKFNVSFTIKDWYTYKTRVKPDYIDVTAPRQDLNIPQGWSGISTYIIPVPDSVETMFSPIDDKLIILYNLSGVYWPGQNLNTLVTWNNYSGYVIKVNEDAGLCVLGANLSSNTVSVAQGWNLIPVFTVSDAASLFGSLPGFVVAKGVATAEILWPAYNIASLQTLNTGKAYFIYTTQAGSITYAKSASSPALPPPEMNLHTPWNDLAITPYTHLVAFTTESLKTLEAGDPIAAFNSAGYCTGTAEISDLNRETALILYGDDPTTAKAEGFTGGEQIILKCYRPSSGELFDLDVTWNEQLNHSGLFETNGLSAVIKIITGSTNVSILQPINVNIYPNPTQGNFIISGIESECLIRIFNTLGDEVYTLRGILPASINLSSQPKGVYLVKITYKSSNIFNKLIIN
ncbi:MAG: T9SS type A sorting domain-containing protein, partial [Sphingobacteriia bacterium]|nr:T9SS type A sorting domain-containing protein [Sphingobacteriia bacterium]